MNPVADLIAAELPRHVDLILWSKYDENDQRVDTGGLTCSCGQWSAPRDQETGTRPRRAYTRHCAEAVHRAITTQDAVDTLAAINERLILPRVGLSMMREMDRDIVTLQAAAATLTVLLAPNRWTGDPQHPESTRPSVSPTHETNRG